MSGTNSSVYVVTDGQVGGINVPQAAPGSVVQTPASIAWQPGTSTGSLTFQYLDANANTGPLQAGAMSGTIVVLTDEKSTTMPFVSIQNANPQVGYPQAYRADRRHDFVGPGGFGDARARDDHRLDERPRRPRAGPPRPPQSPGGLNPPGPGIAAGTETSPLEPLAAARHGREGLIAFCDRAGRSRRRGRRARPRFPDRL